MTATGTLQQFGQAKDSESWATKRVIGYARISTKDYSDMGARLEVQEDAIQKEVQAHGRDALLAHELYNEDYSGSDLHRPKFDIIREKIRKREIDVLVCYCQDRFSRGDPLNTLLLLRECDEHDVEVVFILDPLDKSPMGQMITFFRAWAAQVERLRILDRTTGGKMKLAKSGKIVLPGRWKGIFGMDYDAGERALFPNENIDHVRRIFRLFLDERLSCEAIAKILRGEGVCKPGGTTNWWGCDIRRILTNLSYTGTYAYRKVKKTKRRRTPEEYVYAATHPDAPDAHPSYDVSTTIRRNPDEWIIVENAWPGPIAKADFERVPGQMAENTSFAKRNTKADFPLQHMVRCAGCGRFFGAQAQYRTRSDGTPYVNRYYQCHCGKKTDKVASCIATKRHLAADKLEQAVWQTIYDSFAEERILRMRQERDERSDIRDNWEQRRFAVAQKLDDLKGRERRTMAKLEADEEKAEMTGVPIDPDRLTNYEEIFAEIERDRKMYRTQLATIDKDSAAFGRSENTEAAILHYAQHFRALLETKDMAKIRAIYRLLQVVVSVDADSRRYHVTCGLRLGGAETLDEVVIGNGTSSSTIPNIVIPWLLPPVPIAA